MKKEDFLGMVDDDKYQIFIMKTPISIPFSMFVHTYIVTSVHGTLTRWDVFHKPCLSTDSNFHVYRNITEPWQGLSYFYFGMLFAYKLSFNAVCIGTIKGSENSLAHQMIMSLHEQAFNYKYCEHYRLLGPNSNTFVQNFLNQHPGHDITLPKSALGKGRL